MSEVAEFFGGPWDGSVRALPKKEFAGPAAAGYNEGHPKPSDRMHKPITTLEGLRNRPTYVFHDAETGEPIPLVTSWNETDGTISRLLALGDPAPYVDGERVIEAWVTREGAGVTERRPYRVTEVPTAERTEA